MGSLLIEQHAVEGSVDARHLAAAIFGLAEQGAVDIEYRDQTVKLTQRSQPVNNLDLVQRSLHRSIFKRDTLPVYVYGNATSTRFHCIEQLNRLIAEEALRGGKTRRLISTWRWRIGLTVLLGLWVTLGVLAWDGPRAWSVAGVIVTVILCGLAYSAYFKTEATDPPQPGVIRDGVLSLLLWSQCDDRRQALLLSEIASWTQNNRMPSWWRTDDKWPGNNAQQLLNTYNVLVQAFC